MRFKQKLSIGAASLILISSVFAQKMPKAEPITPKIVQNLDSARFHNDKGVDAFNLKDYKTAMEEYNKAIDFAPRYARAYNNRGILNRVLGDYDAALTDYTDAIYLWPDYANAYKNRAKVYDLINMPESAEADRRKYRELTEEKP